MRRASDTDWRIQNGGSVVSPSGPLLREASNEPTPPTLDGRRACSSREMIAAGRPMKEAAREFGRTEEAVRGRPLQAGLIAARPRRRRLNRKA